ncbi:MAG: aldehyde ferredoxin oxidoreductase family protein [Clostridia bacterium]|nr:aldehyde ferredoxin oxidoreductase family protein [Clostridia bacterium]
MTIISDNKIAYIDLTDKSISLKPISPELRKKFIGGPGINTKILFDSEAMYHDALSEKNVLIFGVGMTVGTGLLAANRCTITAKSPLTDIFGDANVGGDFMLNMRSVGVDHLVFTGKSETPVYVYINKEGVIEIRDASDIWGTCTNIATDILTERHGKDCEVACIGPAGENLVRFASVIISKTHAAGRTGMGCVMGSKKLKAVVVERAKLKLKFHDSKKIASIRKRWLKVSSSSMLSKNTHIEGSLFLVERYNKLGHLPVRNCQTGSDPKAENLYTKNFKFEYVTKKVACVACPIACGKRFEIKEGKYKGVSGERIEYGSATSVGPAVGIFDWPSVLHLKLLSDYYGLDTIEMGGVLALILEACERGILKKEDVDGRELHFGNADDAEYLIHKLVRREGIGNCMAEGVYRASKAINAEKYALCVKKSSTGTHSKQRLAWSLGYITSTRGGDHLKNFPFSMLFGGYFSDLLAKYIFNVDAKKEITKPEKKGRVVWWHENYKYTIDSLGLCLFAIHALPNLGHGYYDDFADVLNAMYDLGLKDIDVFYAADRIYQLQNAFNILCGMSIHDYKWPERIKDENIEDKYIEETTIKVRDNPGMLPEYFRFRGLTSEGKPTVSRFTELGLGEYIEKACAVKCDEVESISQLLQEVKLNVKFSFSDRIKVHIMSKIFCKLIELKDKKEKKEYMKSRNHQFKEENA